MAVSTTLQKIGQGLSGVFLGLTGSWLLVICIGGLITLGALSLFHLGILLSLGCMGLCFVMAGVCLLYHVLSRTEPQKNSSRLDEGSGEWSLQTKTDFLKKHDSENRLLHENEKRFNRQPYQTETPSITQSKSSYNPFS